LALPKRVVESIPQEKERQLISSIRKLLISTELREQYGTSYMIRGQNLGLLTGMRPQLTSRQKLDICKGGGNLEKAET
jgi:hypothetical protein